MLAGHYLDKLAIDHTVDWNNYCEEVCEAKDASGPYFWRVLGYINLKETFTLSNCDKLQTECD
jgi:hypothetical protein